MSEMHYLARSIYEALSVYSDEEVMRIFDCSASDIAAVRELFGE